MDHFCTELKFESPDLIARGVNEWLQNNPSLESVTAVNQLTVAVQVGAFQTATGQPQVKYVFYYLIFWKSKPITNG